MKTGNRLFAILLALAMVLTYMPALAFAEELPNGEPPAAGDDISGNDESGSNAQGADLEGEEPGADDPIVNEEGDGQKDPEDNDDPDAEPKGGDENAPGGDDAEQPSGSKAPVLRSGDGGEGDGDDGEDPFAGIYLAELERTDSDLDWFFEDGSATFRLTDEQALNIEGVVVYEPYVISTGPSGGFAAIDESCWDYDNDTKTIVVSGAALAAIPEYDDLWKITVQIKGKDADENVKMIASAIDVKYWATYIRYDLPQDRTVLPRWDGTINDAYDGYVENTAHPHGDNFRFGVKDVEVTEGRDLLRDWHPDSDDNGNRWWYYRAGNEPGTVTFSIIYYDIDGNEQTAETHLYIGGDVYESNMWTDDNLYIGLPGSSIGLNASAGHKYLDENGNEQYTEDGLDYIWSFTRQDADKYAVLDVDENDHSRATLTFKEPEDGDYNEVGCRVKLTIVDTNSDEPEAERSSQDRWFELRDEYTLIWPNELNPGLNIGQTMENIKFEVRHYKYGEDSFGPEGYEELPIENAKWDFDSDAFRITKAGGGDVAAGETYADCDTFSFKRLSDRNTMLRLTVNETGMARMVSEYVFFNQDYDFWFDPPDIDLYADASEDPVFRIDTGRFGYEGEADEAFDFDVEMGEWDGDDWSNKLPASDYDVSREGNDLVITIDRTKLDPESFAYNKDLRVYVKASTKDGDFVYDRDAWLHLREVRYDFDQEDHMEMLPGWDHNFEWLHVYIENSEHPDGEDFDFHVKNVDVIDGEEHLEEVPTAENGWYFRARDYGQVNFVLTYEDEHGDDKTYEVEVNITGDIYETWLHSEEPYNTGLPGASMQLRAEGVHKYVDENGWHQEDWDGFDYEWEITRGGEFATITRDTGDHSRAVLKLKNLPLGSDWIDEQIDVKVSLKDPGSDDPSAERAAGWQDFRVKSEFEEVWPPDFGGDINLGTTSEDITFEVRRYSINGSEEDGYHDGFRSFPVKTARWNYDDNAITVYAADGKEVPDGSEVEADTFRIARLREWGTDTELQVTYINEYGDEQDAYSRFWIDNLRYNLWFDSDNIRVYDDGKWTVELQKEEWLDYSNLDIRFSAGEYRWNEEADEDEWIDAPDDCWSVSDDGSSVTVFGDKMHEHGIDSMMLIAQAFYGEGDEAVKLDADDAQCWVNLEESCISHGEAHLWLSAAADYPDCTSAGTQKQVCWNCMEKRIVDVPPRGHIGVAVKAKAATASKEGNIQYWKCSDCGKLFSDAKCTKATTADSRIIPKGVAGLKLTAQKKGFTVTWKKPTGNFLKHTTGYEVMYALDKKFTKSKKTLTITKNSTVSKKVTKLTAKKKYYVKVRAFRTIDGKKYYSPWSTYKTVTTKK